MPNTTISVYLTDDEYIELSEEDIIDKMELISFAANLEALRRVGIVKCVQKTFISDNDSGIYETAKDKKKS